jgi:putative endonuclease
MWLVYIVECADRSLYTGITNDLDQRMAAHRAGKGAKYTKPRRPLTLRYAEAAESKGAALRREAAIKALDRATKLTLIAGYNGNSVEPVIPPKNF